MKRTQIESLFIIKILGRFKMGRYVAIAFTLILTALVFAGCALSSQTFPTGKYSDTFGNTITYSDDGKFTVVTSVGETIVQDGQYTIDGDVITFNESEICPPTDGVYKWSYDDGAGILQFETVEDDCPDRYPGEVKRLP
jgi:hypothetical protein